MFRTLFFSIIISAVSLYLSSCTGTGNQQGYDYTDTLSLHHAKLLHIYQSHGYKVAVIMNPWKPAKELHRYILLPEGKEMAQTPGATILHLPLKGIVAATAVHASLMAELGALHHMTGICDPQYIQNDSILHSLLNRNLLDMGNSLSPNTEKILSSHADAILVSPFEESGYGVLQHIGVPLIECADYMEPTALGRAEWIRFYGMLVGKEREADSIFSLVEKNYHSLTQQALQTPDRPTLICDLMQGAAWYMPGTESTIGQILHDAGAHYIFSNSPGRGSRRLSFETVYHQGAKAQFWIIKYGRNEDHTYSSLLQENPRYAQFEAFKHKQIYGCNTYRLPFFEEEPFHPDYYLSDLIRILHPGLLPEGKTHFFNVIQDEKD